MAGQPFTSGPTMFPTRDNAVSTELTKLLEATGKAVH
jgi:hypothetical protein